MNREQFLAKPDVDGFVEWLSSFSATVVADLNIGRSAYVPRAIVGTVRGFDAILDTYAWRASWTDTNGETVDSLHWDSTARSLDRLGRSLRDALTAGSADGARHACGMVFRWGGERDPNKGARPFIEQQFAAKRLVTYLDTTRAAFSLGTGGLDQLGCVEAMNSMLTKVHALASGDGLPIYDSRVAAAIASLVEIFRLQRRPGWKTIPGELLFPTMANEARRKVVALNPQAMVSTRTIMRYNSSGIALQWAGAKLRLGWIIEAVLERAPELLKHQPHSRQHAFEASLFMLGYDVGCLGGNL